MPKIHNTKPLTKTIKKKPKEKTKKTVGRPAVLTPEKEERIIELFQQEKSLNEIACDLKIGKTTLTRYLEKKRRDPDFVERLNVNKYFLRSYVRSSLFNLITKDNDKQTILLYATKRLPEYRSDTLPSTKDTPPLDIDEQVEKYFTS